MIWAEVENGVCVNTVEADEAFAQVMNLVALPGGFGIGDYYAENVWSHDPPAPVVPESNVTWSAMATSIKEGVDDV